MLKLRFPLPVYQRFLAACEPSSREYAILKNGCLDKPEPGDQSEANVDLACSYDDAQLLRKMGHKVCPEAAIEIAKTIDLF